MLGTLRQGNLAVVAVAGAPAAGPALETLDEAMGRGKVLVRETGQGGTVNTLLLENHGERAVFIMAGEILAGAKQDRILQQDVILPTGGKPVPVAAFCVEHGRWREQSAAFFSEKAAAPVAVRQAAQASKSQSVVWQEVASNNAALGVTAATGSLSDTYKRGRVVAVRKAFLARPGPAAARLPVGRRPGAGEWPGGRGGPVPGPEAVRKPLGKAPGLLHRRGGPPGIGSRRAVA